jgi:hypothetical protein
MTTPPNNVQVRYVPAPPKKVNWARRIGCGIALVFWFALLLLPSVFLILLFNNEITITTGDAPDQQIYIYLISEARERGIGVRTGSVASRDDTNVCVQTEQRYLLWQGTGEPATFCECYSRSSSSESWSLASSEPNACPAR